jgi:general secretion pathway protein E
MKPNRGYFGELLVARKLITEEELYAALEKQKVVRRKIGELLVDAGVVSARDMCKALSEFLNVPFIDLEGAELEPPMELGLNLKFLKQHRVLPLELRPDGTLRVAMADPLDFYTIDALRLVLGRELEVWLAAELELLKQIEEHYGSGASTMKMIIEDMSEEDLEILAEEQATDIDQLRDMASEAPVIKLVNLIVSQAVEQRASDIHIEPFEGELRVRFRIDGVLHDQEAPPRRLQPAIISRVKIMAGLNIAERRLPQDGSIRVRVQGKKVDLRVSTVPTLYGESVVMRILDRASIFMDLSHLGFLEDNLRTFEGLIHRPHGIILVTGPTGSGKTTTLYAALDKINTTDKKIITVEDPVEYQLRGINQIQVNPKIGLTFATGLRSIVRQDPDIMMVGEIRDLETAEIAIHSALTGHLVFSTLHTNDAPGAITRLVDMGVESFLVASCLEGVMAQRLVRVICRECREVLPLAPQILRQLEQVTGGNGQTTLYHGCGCKACADTGYHGRTGIYELMIISENIRNMITQKLSTSVIRRAAREEGLRTLREDGWLKVKRGVTTLEEVLRVTQDEEFVSI